MSQTMIFWLLAGVMMVVALALVMPPLLGRGRAVPLRKRRLDLDEQQARLAQLDRALADGELSKADHAKQRTQLGGALLDAISGPPQPSAELLTPRKGLAALVLIALPASSIGLYVWLGSSEALHAQSSQSVAAGSAQEEGHAADGSMEEMVDQLANRLRDNPDDAEGWVMLGRSYMVMERYPEAAEAYTQAHVLIGDEPPLLVDFAEAATLANDNRMDGLPTRLLERALKLDPDNRKGMWLTGFAAMQRNEPGAAVSVWNRLLAQLPPDSQEADAVAKMIAQAGGVDEAPTSESGSAQGPSLEVIVKLDPALAGQVTGDETLFVFARAVDGPPMPLAIQRRRAAELPLTLILDESMTVVPNMTLSTFPVVTVGARISKSGEAAAKSGDLQGLLTPVEVAKNEKVELTISDVVP